MQSLIELISVLSHPIFVELLWGESTALFKVEERRNESLASKLCWCMGSGRSLCCTGIPRCDSIQGGVRSLENQNSIEVGPQGCHEVVS